MAMEELKAEIALLLEQTQNRPEDLHEAYLQLRQRLDELRGLGMPLPEDLIRLEEEMEEEFSKDRPATPEPSA